MSLPHKAATLICLLSMTVMMIYLLIWIRQTIHFRYFTFVNYERHKRKRNDVIGQIIITTLMADVIVTAFYVLIHLQVSTCLISDSRGRLSIQTPYPSELVEFHIWQDIVNILTFRKNSKFKLCIEKKPFFLNNWKSPSWFWKRRKTTCCTRIAKWSEKCCTPILRCRRGTVTFTKWSDCPWPRWYFQTSVLVL